MPSANRHRHQDVVSHYNSTAHLGCQHIYREVYLHARAHKHAPHIYTQYNRCSSRLHRCAAIGGGTAAWAVGRGNHLDHLKRTNRWHTNKWSGCSLPACETTGSPVSGSPRSVRTTLAEMLKMFFEKSNMCFVCLHRCCCVEESVRQPKMDSCSLCVGPASGIHQCVLCSTLFR